MARHISLTHHYSSSPDAVWAVATDLDALARAVEGLIQYRGLPSGRIHEGQVLKVQFSLFGRLPWQDYEMRVVTCNDEAREFRSFEQGGGVKVWRHHLRVLPEGEGARLEEEIEIDAGVMTPVYALWGRYMYAKRHQPRRVMLGEAAEG